MNTVFIVNLLASRTDGTSANTQVVFSNKHDATAFALTMVSSFSINGTTIKPTIFETVLLENHVQIMQYFEQQVREAMTGSRHNQDKISDALGVPIPSDN